MDDLDLFGDVKAFDALICEHWISGLNKVYDCYYQQRRAQLRPGWTRDSGFNAAGVHEVSHAWGQVNLCERLLPELLHAEASLRVVREEAVAQAEADALMHTRLGLVIAGAEQVA